MAGSSWVGLRLDPLDTLFFRDGRPFDAATRVTGGLPVPQTLAGAIRTALLARTGFRFDDFAKERKTGHKTSQVMDALHRCGAEPAITQASFRGPWLALAGKDGVTPLLSAPETLKRTKYAKGWSRARVLPNGVLPGWKDPDGQDPDALAPLWHHAELDPKAEKELLTLKGLQAFLNGDDPPADECVKPADLFGFDNRIGIAVDKHSFTSEDGMLYAIRLLALQPRHSARQVCLYAEVHLDAGWAEKLTDIVVPFGGEGKYVQVQRVAACLPNPAPTQGRSMWYLATPTFFPPTGRPLPREIGLKAAASGPGVAVSGWDVAFNGPRPTRFAVPAGAVYFVEEPCPPTAFLKSDDPLLTDDALRQEGWGFALPGNWEDS